MTPRKTVDRRELTLCPDSLTDAQKTRIRAWMAKRHPTYLRGVGHLWSAHRDFHRSRGNLGLDWEASFRSWVRKAKEIDQRQAAGGDRGAQERLRPQLDVVK